MKTKIYALTDAIGTTRYIGKTKLSLNERLSGHMQESKDTKKNTYKCRWVRKLLSKRLFPLIVLIEEVDGDGDAEEILWIKYYKEKGARLVNGTDGGAGCVGLSPESRLAAVLHAQPADGVTLMCPFCKTVFKPTQRNQRFCCQRHKDAFHNLKKTKGLSVSDSFQSETQKYAALWGKTLQETADIIYSEGLKCAKMDAYTPDQQQEEGQVRGAV